MSKNKKNEKPSERRFTWGNYVRVCFETFRKYVTSEPLHISIVITVIAFLFFAYKFDFFELGKVRQQDLTTTVAAATESLSFTLQNDRQSSWNLPMGLFLVPNKRSDLHCEEKFVENIDLPISKGFECNLDFTTRLVIDGAATVNLVLDREEPKALWSMTLTGDGNARIRVRLFREDDNALLFDEKDYSQWLDDLGNLIQTDTNGASLLFDEAHNELRFDKDGGLRLVDKDGNQLLLDKDGNQLLRDKYDNKLLDEKYRSLPFFDTEGGLLVFDDDQNPRLFDKDGNLIPFDKDGNPLYSEIRFEPNEKTENQPIRFPLVATSAVIGSHLHYASTIKGDFNDFWQPSLLSGHVSIIAANLPDREKFNVLQDTLDTGDVIKIPRASDSLDDDTAGLVWGMVTIEEQTVALSGTTEVTQPVIHAVLHTSHRELSIRRFGTVGGHTIKASKWTIISRWPHGQETWMTFVSMILLLTFVLQLADSLQHKSLKSKKKGKKHRKRKRKGD